MKNFRMLVTLYVKMESLVHNQNLYFELYDMLGKQVINQKLTQTETTINLTGLSSGIYNYRIGSHWGSIVVE